MAIPVYMQNFKSAGVYRVIFDKSSYVNQDLATLRLVVGYSPKGPFNAVTYVTSIAKFRELYGETTKTLEKRGCYFHRIAEQCLADSPILCLNLKKFENETVTASTIDTNFNVKSPIDTVKVPVEDIYDTTRFWTLSADKLNSIRGAEYINIATTNTKQTSGTFFIRKASGSKVQAYNISVKDWYIRVNKEIPEYLQGYETSLMSDFMAEIYVFAGKFVAEQVLSSDTLKKYFTIDTEGKLKLRQYIVDSFGDYEDTLDSLYNDETSGAIGHYVGSLIPYFQDSNDSYAALDILFNQDIDLHNMMMTFNVDMLEEDGIANIDLSGTRFISTIGNDNKHEDKHPTANDYKAYGASVICIQDIWNGTAKTNLLSNINSPVVADVILFNPSVFSGYTETEDGKKIGIVKNTLKLGKKITGMLYVSNISEEAESNPASITLRQIGSTDTINITLPLGANLNKVLYQLGAGYKDLDGEYHSYKEWNIDSKYSGLSGDGLGTYYTDKDGAYPEFYSLAGPKKIITSINKDVDVDTDNQIVLSGDIVKCVIEDVYTVTSSQYCVSDESTILVNSDDPTTSWAVYGSSISFIEIGDKDEVAKDVTSLGANDADNVHSYTIYTKASDNNALSSVISKGDRFLAEDGSVDMDGDGLYYDPDGDEDDKPNGYYDIVSVQSVETISDKNGVPLYHQIKFTSKPMFFSVGTSGLEEGGVTISQTMPGYAEDYLFGASMSNDVKNRKYLVRIDRALNQEIGDMYPTYLEGYTYENPKPNGTGMMAKLNWQNFMMSALSEYEGLRTALLNKSEIDYRYVIDTWESYVDSSLKSVLSQLCKEKQSAFAILNFPSVRTFVKCPYTSFTNEKGVFNVQYVVDGKNKKKAAVKGFGIPSQDEGAAYCAFYTPLKFSDGYVDSIIPSAGIVSNLYMEKYRSRNPYDIVAGPNYGAISASGLIGPDYNYSREELNIIEPYGVNCMVYKQSFGTFINANQTAKQTPKSALSSINCIELVIYLMDEIERILQANQWEFNNQQVRNQIKDRADAICAKVQTNGGLQAYYNVMDESNNDADIIDNEMAVLSTHIEPGRGMGKMVHELSIYRTGVLKSLVLD